MPQVLIPSDGSDVVHSLAHAYAKLGFDVLVGRANFELELARPDIVHLMWPEEFTGWRVPRESEITALEQKLARWGKRSRLIITVHNLYPHRHHGNVLYHRLFTLFYSRAEVIHHTSRTSREMVCQHFPEIAQRNHIVRLGYNYDRLLPAEPRSRAASRKRFGFDDADIVFLVVGSLRTWAEASLVTQAFPRARVSHKKLLLSARLLEEAPRLKRVWHRWIWNYWTRRSDVVRVREHVPDREMHHLLDAADAVVIVRQQSLSSGVPSLAMTFGRMVICPNAGAMPEFVAGAPNELYEETSAPSLARAMERAAAADRESIGIENRKIAASWSWDHIVQSCLNALPREHG